MKKYSLIPLLLTLISAQIVFIQQLFRHGARYPIYSNLNDDINYPSKLGQLTDAGKRMHYFLGKKLADQYSSLLLNYTNISKHIYVKSTDVNRTIQSAESQLLGFLEGLPILDIQNGSKEWSIPPWKDIILPQVGPLYTNEIKARSFPIHVEKGGANGLNPGDFLKTYSPTNCPQQNNWKAQNEGSQIFNKFLKNQRLANAIQKLSQIYNNNKTIDIDDVTYYFDNYICQKYLGIKNLNPIYEQYYQEFYTIYTVALYLQLFYQDIQINATATPFLQASLYNMKNIINGNNQAPRIVLYSAHDTTVANILSALRLTSGKCILDLFTGQTVSNSSCIIDYPAYASNLIFQLQKDSNNEYFVKVRYNGDYKDLWFCNNSKICTFGQFETFISNTVVQNYMQICGIQLYIQQKANDLAYVIVLSCLGGLLVIFVGFELYRFIRKSKDKDQQQKKSLITQ